MRSSIVVFLLIVGLSPVFGERSRPSRGAGAGTAWVSGQDGAAFSRAYTVAAPVAGNAAVSRAYTVAAPVAGNAAVSRAVTVKFCVADIDGSGDVAILDILAILTAWGTDGTDTCTDVNDDGIVNIVDLLAVLVAWGPCEPS